jgi:transcriptional regulator with XRE-family HTH domain
MEKSITKVVKDYMEVKGLKQITLATKLGTTQSNLNQKLAKNDISTQLLFQLCEAMEFDFFNECSKLLPVNIRAKKGSIETSEIESVLKKFIETNYPKIK